MTRNLQVSSEERGSIVPRLKHSHPRITVGGALDRALVWMSYIPLSAAPSKARPLSEDMFSLMETLILAVLDVIIEGPGMALHVYARLGTCS